LNAVVVEAARLEERDGGLVAVTDGWFVLNARDAQWLRSEHFADACGFEGDEAPFAQLGFTLAVLRPGEPSGLYHREALQEDFLVLSGECLLLVEGEERSLRAWDFVHCPPGTEHAFVGAGDGPCVIFMTGARERPGPGSAQPRGHVVYPRSELALGHRAGAEQETSVPKDAYAPYRRWSPGRPDGWDELPWARGA
jgi:uncharacterized cupin superfamily protein